MIARRSIALSALQETLTFDEQTGNLRWRKVTRFGSVKVGDLAGYVRPDGYRYITVDQVTVGAHRIAWAMHYGEFAEKLIDHINQVKTDNRIENLRLCCNSQNMANRGKQVNNTSGFKGVVKRASEVGFRAQIRVRNKSIFIGYFRSAEAAAHAYNDAAKQHFGNYARCSVVETGGEAGPVSRQALLDPSRVAHPNAPFAYRRGSF